MVIKPEFDSNGNPKPIVLVGTNGSGKTAILSSIVDSFYEFGKETKFQDIIVPMNHRGGHQYFKLASHNQIRIGSTEMVAHIRFFDKQRNHNPEYLYHVDKWEDKDWSIKAKETIDYIKSLGITIETSFDKTNPKRVKCNSELLSETLRQEAICFFPADRTYVPDWMGQAYSRDAAYGHINVAPQFTNYLHKPISVSNPFPTIAEWITDVLTDAKQEIIFVDNKPYITVKPELALALTIAKANVESVLSTILQTKVHLQLNLRNTGSARVSIVSAAGHNLLIPTLDALSQGQAVLMNTFLTIVQYADSFDVNKSIRLADISGVVVIDEIDAHLHSDLQRIVLPQLFKLFSKVQFIVSTHSPLFVLGMQSTFGENGFSLLEMPSASPISAEEFSEFNKAYDYLSMTQRYKSAIQGSIQTALSNTHETSKLLVVTEGPSDWKLMKGAWEHIKQDFKDIDGKFEFLEYEPPNNGNTEPDRYHHSMGGDALVAMCQGCFNLPKTQPLVFIADADKDNVKAKLKGVDGPVKKWGDSNVFSFVIPSPVFRGQDAPVCIEHYFSNEEITTSFNVGGKSRRLYLSSEFDPKKHCLKSNHSITCENHKFCGGDTIVPRIIEGDHGCAVLNVDDDSNTNLALSKMEFARRVLEQAPETMHFNFENFRAIFERIRLIATQLRLVGG